MAGGYNTGQATVATTATVIAPRDRGRKTITIVNGGTTDVYVGGAAVTTSTGVLLTGTKERASLSIRKVRFTASSDRGTQAVSHLETL